MNFFSKPFLLAIALFSGMITAVAQPQNTDLGTTKATMGKLVGQIIDKTNGELISGATVLLEGASKGARTDIEGRYTISNIQPGVYTVVVRYTSYEPKTISNVEVNGKEPVVLNISLEEKKVNITGGVVVKASLKKESTNTLLIQQKSSLTVSDGISIETIRKTPDRNTGDILKRVSGASLQDNKYAVVRGLPDRYNTAFINGAPLPSSEPDRKAFALDIFPAAMIDKLVILKTATPDLPAEWAGGIIQIQTRDIPDENFYNLSLGIGLNTITTFKPFYTNVKGKYDWLGLDDGTRSLPKGIPNTKEFNKQQDAAYATYSETDPNPYQPAINFVAMGKQFQNNYVLNEVAKARPNLQGQYSMGHSVKLSKKYNITFGSIMALTYNNNLTYNEILRQDFDEAGRQNFRYEDQNYSSNTMAGALWNLSLKWGSHSKFSLKNIYNINTTDQTILRNGADSAVGFDIKAYTMWYTQNQLRSHQFSGEHLISPKYKIKVTYGAGYSKLEREVPDLRRVRYQRGFVTNAEDTQAVKYYVPLGSTGNSDVAGRFYSTQEDNIYSGNFDVAIPFKAWKGRLRNEIKVGYFGQTKDRTFDARLFGYTTTPVYDYSKGLNYSDINSLFDPSNIDFQVWGSRLDPNDPYTFIPDSIKGTMQVNEITSGSDSYSASSYLNAGYVRLDNQLWEKYRLIWGVRMEQYHQSLITIPVGQTEFYEFDTTVVDFLPSVNFIYSVTKKQNIRLGFSQTVSRPEFRELAPFAFFDFNENYMNIGSVDLLRTKITNYDARWEFYPHAGQVISASIFYKHFANPIERTMLSAGNVRNVTFQNVPEATAFGLEIDFRTNIGAWLNKDKKHAMILDELFLVGNLSLIKSRVDLTGVSGVDETIRPLQGQSPYIVNGGIQYMNEKYKWGFSAMFNRYGRRITNVGFIEYPSVYERSRNVLDLQINKTFGKHLDTRLAVRDLLANDGIFYQDVDKDKKYSGNDQLIWKYRYGRTISLTLSYKF